MTATAAHLPPGRKPPTAATDRCFTLTVRCRARDRRWPPGVGGRMAAWCLLARAGTGFALSGELVRMCSLLVRCRAAVKVACLRGQLGLMAPRSPPPKANSEQRTRCFLGRASSQAALTRSSPVRGMLSPCGRGSVRSVPFANASRASESARAMLACFKRSRRASVVLCSLVPMEIPTLSSSVADKRYHSRLPRTRCKVRRRGQGNF